MLKNILFLTLIFIAHICVGQEKLNPKSFEEISDTIIKNEVAFFTIKGTNFTKTNPAVADLIEIPIRNCSEKEVYLSLSKFISSPQTFIHFYFIGEAQNKKLDSIFLVTHSHFLIDFPVGSFNDLQQPNTCSFNAENKKSTYHSEYFKAYYSKDKKRLYIYMQGGSETTKYEVTWVIVNDRYYSQIFDVI